MQSFRNALDVDSTHVPSLISVARLLTQMGGASITARSFLRDAVRIDQTNHTAWYYLGLLYKADVNASLEDAVECFEVAAMLEESAPVEPFR